MIDALLDDLGAALREAGAPAYDYLRPGVDASDPRLRGVPFADLRQLYRWHDGTRRDVDATGQRCLYDEYVFLALDEMLEIRADGAEVGDAAQRYDLDPHVIFPFMTDDVMVGYLVGLDRDLFVSFGFREVWRFRPCLTLTDFISGLAKGWRAGALWYSPDDEVLKMDHPQMARHFGVKGADAVAVGLVL